MADILHAFGVNWKLLVIQLINFGILLYLLRRFLYRPLFAMMEKRQEKLKQGLLDAESVKEEKASMADAKQGILRDARKEGDKLISSLRSRGEEEEKRIVSDAEAHAQKLIHDGEVLGMKKKEEIINTSKEELARLAVKAAEQILRARKA